MLAVERELFCEMAEVIAGPLAKEILKIIIERGEVTDEELAKELNQPVNDVRTVLQKLFDARILRYRRIKDERTGWYIYYWRLTDESAEVIYKQRKQKVLAKLKKRYEYEVNNTFYVCINGDIPRLTFDEAFNNMFKCPVCGGVLEPEDNSKIIEVLQELIEKISNDP